MARRTAPPQQTSADLAPVAPIWRVSDDVRAVARRLIGRYPTQFGFIDNHSFRIAYLARTDGPPDEVKIDTVGKCVKAAGPVGFLADIDFVIWVNDWYWANFPQHHEAIVLHELLHVGVTDKGRPALYKHDVEEFIGVVAQYGAWEGNRKRFAEALARHGAEHPEPDPDLADLAEEARALGVTHVDRDGDTTRISIDTGKVTELRNRARATREGRDA